MKLSQNAFCGFIISCSTNKLGIKIPKREIKMIKLIFDTKD